MEPFTAVAGRAAVLPRPNIDTDIIIRIDRLTESRTHPEGRRLLGRWAFEALRYDAEGAERVDCVLNDPALKGAPILIAGENFGCGSSREGAVWAMQGAGFRCVIAESFGDIFQANCFQNGVLPVTLAPVAVAGLAEEAEAGATLRVDLDGGLISTSEGTIVPFAIDAGRRTSLLLGLDEIGLTLKRTVDITAWQAADRSSRPWAWLERD